MSPREAPLQQLHMVPIDMQIAWAMAQVVLLDAAIQFPTVAEAMEMAGLRRRKACADSVVATLRWVRLCGLQAVHPATKPDEAANG